VNIDERAAACAEEICGCYIGSHQWEDDIAEKITRHIRESVAEHVALLKEALGLRELGALEERTPIKGRNAQRYTNEANDIVARITAMIGGAR